MPLSNVHVVRKSKSGFQPKPRSKKSRKVRKSRKIRVQKIEPKLDQIDDPKVIVEKIIYTNNSERIQYVLYINKILKSHYLVRHSAWLKY